MPRTEVLVDGLDHPEGVAWDPAGGILWAGGEDGRLCDGLTHFPNGCAVTSDGASLWLVESHEPTVRIDLASGEVEKVARLEGTAP